MTNLAHLDVAMAKKHGIPGARNQQTVGGEVPLEAGWKMYLSDRAKPLNLGGTADSTVKKYRGSSKKHMAFAKKQGIETWNQIRNEHVEQYAEHLHHLGVSSRTIYFEISVLKSVIKFLIDKRVLTSEHRITTVYAKPTGSDAFCYTLEQVSAMIDHCRKTPDLDWLGDVFIGLACTGLRINELASLRCSDIDLGAETIRLTDERWSYHRKVIGSQRHTKGKRSRTLPIHPELKKVLLRLTSSGLTGRVFRNAHGRKLHDSTVLANLKRRVIEPLKRLFPKPPGELGFEDGHIHSFRHYFCSEAFRNGATEPQLLEWLGHRESKMVAHYRHLRPDDAKRLMKTMTLLTLDPGTESSRI